MAAESERFDPYQQWLGIGPDQHSPSHYRLFGLEDFEQDVDVVAQAAKRVMANVQAHGRGPRAAWSQRLLEELAAARACLLDPRRKEEYDQSLRVKRGIQNLPRQSALDPVPSPPQASRNKPPLHASEKSISGSPPIRTLVARRRARKQTRELVSFLILVAVLMGLVITALALFRN